MLKASSIEIHLVFRQRTLRHLLSRSLPTGGGRTANSNSLAGTCVWPTKTQNPSYHVLSPRRHRRSVNWGSALNAISLVYHTPLGYTRSRQPTTMAHRQDKKLLARIKRIRGQVDAIERSLAGDTDCADILMLLANVRGGINSLMAEVLEDHIREHMLQPGQSSLPSQEVAEDLIDLVRAYLK